MSSDPTAAPLPETDKSLLVRTDFSDDEAWAALQEEIDGEYVTFVADPGYRELTVERLLALVPAGSVHPVLVVADEVTFSAEEHALLMVDLDEEPGRTFRAVPDAVPTVVGNLSIQNLYFSDYLESVDGTGVYRLSARYFAALAELQATGQATAGTRHTASVPGPRQPNLTRRAHPGIPAQPNAPAVRPRTDEDPSSG